MPTALHPVSPQFDQPKVTRHLLAADRLLLHLIRFDSISFDPNSFAHHAIPMPPEISRSVRKRQAEFFHGRIAAREALLQFVPQPPAVGVGQLRQPLWPHGYCGSITHTERYAAAVVLPTSCCTGIGIDIECLRGGDLRQILTGTVLDGDELSCIEDHAGTADLNTLLTIAFSAKECFYKAAFEEVGHFLDFDVLTLRAIHLQRQIFEFELRVTLSPGLQSGARQLVHFDWLDPTTICTAYLRTT